MTTNLAKRISSPLIAAYERSLAARGFSKDPGQLALLHKLDDLRQVLEKRNAAINDGSVTRILRFFGGSPPPTPRGLYIWGGVGRGKTWLMDLFFDSLSFRTKQRVHFHRFMHKLQMQLRDLKNVQNPLQTVGEQIAQHTEVLCFDEFYVSDIGDAMLLGGLLESLLERGVVLVATSNTAPEDLYQDGLQRARFLPAIALIKAHTEVVAFPPGEDYRMAHLGNLTVYLHPADVNSDRKLAETFATLSDGVNPEPTLINVAGRVISARGNCDDIAWFDFQAICGGPRAASDYIELARCYKSVIVSNVPVLTAHDDNAARRFINMVDEFYDRGINLIISAAVAPDNIYQGDKLSGPFARTASRLIEMQSPAYLSQGPHP